MKKMFTVLIALIMLINLLPVSVASAETEYVEAARSIGVGSIKIMFRHIMPNCIPSLIVLYTLNVPSCILSESTLSFLGIGVQPPAASWGLMVNQSKQFLFTMPWLALAPSIAIMAVGDDILAKWPLLLVLCITFTLVTIAAGGLTTQFLIRLQEKREGKARIQAANDNGGKE